MPEPFFERLGSIGRNSRPIRQHLLKPSCPMTQAPENEMVDPQEVESEIPPDRLAGPYHVYSEGLHIGIDPQRNVAARSVSIRKVSVLVRQHGAECISAESIQVRNPKQK